MIALLVAVLGTAFAQRAVSGTVTGDDGELLIGASVAVKGTSSGARTDVNGKYSVNVPAGAGTLVLRTPDMKLRRLHSELPTWWM